MEFVRVKDVEYDEMRVKQLSDVGHKPSRLLNSGIKAVNASYSRPIYLHVCPVCGSQFEGIKTAITCSDKCRQKRRRSAR